MGFGLIFIGYLFMFSFPYHGFDILPDIIGFIISYFGLKTLSEYGCGFDNLKRYFNILLPASAVTALLQLICLFVNKHSIVTVWEYIYTAFILLYNVLLLIAIYKIADDTDLKTIKAKAKRNLFLGIVYYILIFFLNFPIDYIQKLNLYLTEKLSIGLVLFLFGYVWMFLNLSLIFNCYMWICKPGDEDMPVKERKKLFKKDEEE